MPRKPRHSQAAFDRLSLMRELVTVVEREEAGEVTVRWWSTNGRRFVEVSKVASWMETSTESVLDQARALDRMYLAERGRRISAERLARELHIGKERALDLVKRIRREHEESAR